MISLLLYIGKNASVKGRHSASSVFDQMIDFIGRSSAFVNSFRGPTEIRRRYQMQYALACGSKTSPKSRIILSDVTLRTRR